MMSSDRLLSRARVGAKSSYLDYRGGARGAQKARPLSKEQRQEIKEAFDTFDSENTGKMEYYELKVAIRAMGFDIKKQEAQDLMARYDREDTGYIGFEAFEEIMTARYANQDPMEEIRKAFELFDEEKRGKISFRNLRRIARDLGEKLTDEE